jgi:hypothetical protein
MLKVEVAKRIFMKLSPEDFTKNYSAISVSFAKVSPDDILYIFSVCLQRRYKCLFWQKKYIVKKLQEERIVFCTQSIYLQATASRYLTT